MQPAELIAGARWMRSQPARVAEALLAEGRVRVLAAGEWAQGEGDPAAGLVGVLHGRLGVETSTGADATALIDIVHPGMWLGQAAIGGGGPRIVTLRALAPARVLRVPQAALMRIGRDHPSLWQGVSALMYGQLQAMVRTTAWLLATPPANRLPRRLLMLATGDPPVVEASQTELAELCGLSRKAVNERLGALAAAGLIRRGYRRVDLLDRAGLAQIA